MTAKRKVEVFSAGCPACGEVAGLVKRTACPAREVSVLHMGDAAVAERAKRLGFRAVPAVVIDGGLASCCRDVAKAALRAAGIGEARP